MATLNASNITGSSGQSASSTRAAATDSGSRGRLTLRIRDLASFVRDHGDVAGDWLLVSGIKWRLLASMWDGFIATRLEGRHCDNSRWHSKCRYRMRLCNTSGRHETREAFQLFDAASNGWGFRWMHGPKLLADNTGFVVNNTATFDCEVTTFSCYVTDGAYGVRTRFHDVSFKFNKLDRIVFLYANKGFLAANANFFEAMFYGEFSDKNKEEVDLSGVDSDDFAWFLKAISPNPPDIQGWFA